MLISLSVVCQAEALTRHFIVKLEQDAGSPKQNIFIKPHRCIEPGDSSGFTDTYDYAGSTSLLDENRHRFGGYGGKTIIMESLSWQWLDGPHLLVAYNLILTTKDAPISVISCSWLPVEVVFAVGWLLKSYWNLCSPLFKPIKQQVATSVLTKEGYMFAITTVMPGSGDNPPQYTPSESFGQQVPSAIIHPKGYFTHLLHPDSDGGNGDPHHYSHTLGLSCFVHPCHGVCQFRPSGTSAGQSSNPHSVNKHCHGCIHYFDSGYASRSMTVGLTSTTVPDGTLNEDVQIPGNLSAKADDQVIIDGLLSLGGHSLPEKNGISCTIAHSSRLKGFSSLGCLITRVASQWQQAQSDHTKKYDTEQKSCDVTVVGEDGQKRPCGKYCKNSQALWDHKSRVHSEQKTCDETVNETNGQQRPCGAVCKSARSLSCHKSKYHRGQRICDESVIGEDGQPRPCGTVCKNANALSVHKNRIHSGHKTCGVIVVGEDGQQWSCGKVCKNTRALADHKSRVHSGQQTCDLTMVGEDGLPRPCGKVSNNAYALLSHKRREHRGQQTCHLIVVGEDSQQQGCNAVCKSAISLSHHKRLEHTGQQVCNLTAVGVDGQSRQCGKVYKNARSLSNHKRKKHSGPKTCGAKVFGEDGQPQPCGKVCMNAQNLADHKFRDHTGHQTCDFTVVGEHGQPKPCGTVCRNARALFNHKRVHRKRKPVDLDQNDDLSP
ncbi:MULTISPECIES: hypothetical protein [unclassified Endozoicomonas]|uniref:hypothetical protein n=1 Tax=unclassified Endozoicomonas TaxID=2644528 RepID=UPI002148FB5E|nr:MULTISPECIES: hypothetical protein [unclassified Endozoicomonas]